MAITPVDILHTKFATALRGYNKDQVDEFVRAVTQSLEEALKERCELQRELQSLRAEVERVRQIESTMTEALTLAQKTADETRANAHKQAEMIVQEAEQARVRMMVEAQQEAEKCRGEIALLQAARDRFQTEFRALLTCCEEWLDRRGSGRDVPQSEVA